LDLPSMTSREIARALIPEVRFCSEFLTRTGWTPKWTLSDSWRAFSRRFCIADYEALDLYWPKYDPHAEFRTRVYRNRITEFLNFADWLSLVAADDQRGDVAPEHLLDMPQGHWLLPAEGKRNG
jgi:hypothetical protein